MVQIKTKSFWHSTTHMIIAYPVRKRKPYFINKPLINRKYYPYKEAVTIIKRSYLYLTLVLSFLLGSYQGFIALWEEGKSKPTQVYPYTVSSLPEADQALISKGIPITSRQQLQYLLEDYLS